MRYTGGVYCAPIERFEMQLHKEKNEESIRLKNRVIPVAICIPWLSSVSTRELTTFFFHYCEKIYGGVDID